MKYWINKYALTKGVYEVEGKRETEMIISAKDEHGKTAYYHGKDWAETKWQSVVVADEMRTKKIASLHKQIERLERMEF